MLTLVSFDLCPYVQRAAIVLAEKGVPFARRDVDLAAKPDWFTAMSPLGKVPLLQVGDEVLFESAVIVEYLEDTQEPALHPADPLIRARHRAWMEMGSSILADLWTIETTPDRAAFEARAASLRTKFQRLEAGLSLLRRLRPLCRSRQFHRPAQDPVLAARAGGAALGEGSRRARLRGAAGGLPAPPDVVARGPHGLNCIFSARLGLCRGPHDASIFLIATTR